MARVVLVGNLAQVTGGAAEFHLPVTSVQQLFRQLGELYPALERHLESGVAVAIDGQIFQDALLEPIRADSEVFVLPQIAGGTHDGVIRRGQVLHSDIFRADRPVGPNGNVGM
jgi:molybdopterin converting factor small subunit